MAKMWHGDLLSLHDSENEIGERLAELRSYPTVVGLRITPTEEELNAGEAAIPIVYLPIPSAKQSTN